MSYRKVETAQFVYLITIVFVVAAVTLFGGCGSDSPSGPKEPVGTHPLTGTATIDDADDVGDHAGTKLTVLASGSAVATTKTGADGSFTLPDLANGDYTLKASRDFYSTLTKNIQVRDSLLVDPIGSLELELTFFIVLRTDSLEYTHESDSVFVWMVLKNENTEDLDLFNLFVIPYDFVVIDHVELEEEIWLWSLHKPDTNDVRYDFEAFIPAMDSLFIYPPGDVRAWGKSNQEGTEMEPGYYDIEARIELRDDRGVIRPFKSKRHVVRLVS